MTSCELTAYTAMSPVKGEGPQKKKSAASSDSRGGSIFCHVFLPALGMFVFGVGVVCWMNCPRLHVDRLSVGNSAVSSSAGSISASNLRSSYVNNIQSNSLQVSTVTQLLQKRCISRYQSY
jgi:hypothetical protein